MDNKNRRRHRKSVIPFDASQFEYISKLGKSSLKSLSTSSKEPDERRGIIDEASLKELTMGDAKDTIEDQVSINVDYE